MAVSVLRRSMSLLRNLVPSLSISRKCYVSEGGPPGGWFPAGPGASLMDARQRQGDWILGTYFTLRSAKPLDATIIHQALRYLYRKSPPLRACLKTHNETLWMCEMEKELIDFEEIDTTDPQMYMKSQINIPFESSGPLWRARYLPMELPSLPPHTGLHLPHECQILFNIHHGIWDGLTASRVYVKFVEIINDIITDQFIDDKQVGVMGSEKPIRHVKSSLMGEVDGNEELKRNFDARRKGSLLMEAFKPPSVRHSSTGFILKHLDNVETSDFTEKCKKAGITMNSVLIAIVNTAIVELVKEHFVDNEYFDISYNLPVDNRRYSKESADKLGYLVSSLTHGMKTPVNVREVFWEYAKDLHNSISKSYNEAEHLQQEILREREQTKVSSNEKNISGIPPVLTDFFFTNLGNITKLYGSKGSQVEMSALIPYNSMQKLNYTNGHVFSSYHGSLQYLLIFSEYYMDHYLAHRLGDTVMDLIKSV